MSPTTISTADHHHGPLIGRAPERATLCRALEAAGAGSGRVVWISGVAGIGKTSLVGDAVREARERAMPVSAARPLLVDDGRPFDVVLRAVERLVEMSDLAAGMGAASTLAAIEAALRARAPRPALLVIDDLHRADRASFSAIEYLLDIVGSLPLVLIVAGRRGQCPAVDDVHRRCVAHHDVDDLVLAPLCDDEMIDVVRSQPLALAPDAERVIVRLAAGNPQRAIELGHDATAADGAAVLRRHVAALVEQHEFRGVLACLAVSGTAVSSGDLARVLGIERIAVGECLTGATAAGLLAVDESDGTYRFADDEYAAAALVDPVVAASVHRARALDLLEHSLPHDRTTVDHIARHLRLAGRADTVTMAAAARRCADAGAFADGLRLAEQALAQDPRGGLTIDLLRVAGRCAYHLGDFHRAELGLDTALGQAWRTADPASIAGVMADRLRYVPQHPDYALFEQLGRTVELLDDVVDDLDDLDDAAVVDAVRLYVEAALAHIETDLPRSAALGDRAMDLAHRSGLPRAVLAAHAFRICDWRSDLGQVRESVIVLDRFSRWSPEAGLLAALGRVSIAFATGTREDLRLAIAEAERAADAWPDPHLCGLLVIAMLAEAGLSADVEAVQRVVASDRWAFVPRTGQIADFVGAQLRVWMLVVGPFPIGENDAAFTASPLIDRKRTLFALAADAVAAELGFVDLERLAPRLRAYVAEHPIGDCRDIAGASMAALAGMAGILGASDIARHLGDHLWEQRHGVLAVSPSIFVGPAGLFCAEALSGAGDHDRALAAAAAGAAVCDRLGASAWVARLRLVEAKTFRRAGRLADAATALTEAEEISATLGLSTVAMAAAHERTILSDAARSQGAELTSRELSVLQVLATGASNKEIAAELGIGVRTVEHHLASIFRRLDTSNRTAAVVAARAQGLVDADR